MKFELDAKLKEDTFFVCDLSLCQILLMNNANYPWLILVPQRAQVSELFDLSEADQNLLIQEINYCAKKLKQFSSCDKINIGLIGNIVKQLHIHIVARYTHDTVWPQPVWGKDRLNYNAQEAQEILARLQKKLTIE